MNNPSPPPHSFIDLPASLVSKLNRAVIRTAAYVKCYKFITIYHTVKVEKQLSDKGCRNGDKSK